MNIIIAFYSIINYTDPMESVKRTYRSTLRTEQTEVTRRRILEAARLLFARQGYQGATMDQLAEEAGVAMQTLYAAFGSKFKLAGAVIDEALASIGIPEMVRQQAGEIGDAEQTLRYAAQVTRLVNQHLVDLESLISSADRHEMGQVSDRKREHNSSGVLATVLDSPRRRQDLSNDEIRDAFLALTSLTLYRMLVKERGWAADRYEQWLGDLLIASLLQ